MAAPGHLFTLKSGRAGHAPLLPPALRGERGVPPSWPDEELDERQPERGPEERARVVSFVESQIVPRLVLGQTRPAQPPLSVSSSLLALGDSVAAFATLLLHRNIDDALSFMTAAQDRGHTIEALYLGLLTPTARHCGRLWEDDLMSFADVSIVAARLHQLLHVTGPYGLQAPCGAVGRDIVLLAQPGAQHMLGLSMVRAFFRKAGWRTCMAAPDTMRELASLTRDNWFAVAGFAVTNTDQLEAVRTGITAVRRASRNHRIGIIVGGPVLVEHPEYACQLGADSVALDGEAAVKQAEDLLVVPA